MESYEQSIDATFFEVKPAFYFLVDSGNIFDYLIEHSNEIVQSGNQSE